MSLREFENVLDKMEIGFFRYDSGGYMAEFDSPTYKKVFTYPIMAKEEQGGHVSLSCLLPPAEVELKGRARFLEYLGRKLKDTIVEFDKKREVFVVYTYLSPGCHEEELKKFQSDCDLVVPMLFAVGFSGIWDTTLVDMMLAPPNTLAQA